MSELPKKTIDAACAPSAQGWRGMDMALRARLMAGLEAATSDELGPDRLVVAGPYEQEIIAKVVGWLRCGEGVVHERVLNSASYYADLIEAGFVARGRQT